MIDETHTNALLAAAAYADWNASELDIRTELINNRGFTEAQLDDFFFGPNPKYEKIAYTEDLNGFSATIFKNIDTTSADFNKLTKKRGRIYFNA